MSAWEIGLVGYFVVALAIYLIGSLADGVADDWMKDDEGDE